MQVWMRMVFPLLLVTALCSGSWSEPEETTLTIGLLWGSDAPELVVVSGQGEWRSELARRSFAGSLYVRRDGGRLCVTGPDGQPVLAARIHVFPAAESVPLGIGGRSYPGSLVIEPGAAGGLRVLNHITPEDYVLGTLPHQVFDTAPREAMRTQAVVLRTRALYEVGKRHSGDGFDLCSKAGCCWEYGLEEPPPQRVMEAVRSTVRQVLCYEGKPILACFDANAGGWTEDIDRAWPGSRPLDYPYLRRVASPTDEPGALATRDYVECWEWKDRPIQSNGIRERMHEEYRTDIGQVSKLEVRSQTRSGRVVELVVSGTKASRLVVGSDQVRRILGTPSSLLDPDICTMCPTDGIFRISGRGQGSGVGLSQHGALGMALDDAEYDEILGHYYPGVSLVEDLGRGHSRLLSPDIRERNARQDDSLGGLIIRVGLFFGADAPAAVSVLGSGIWRAGQQQVVFDGEVLAEARGDQVVLVSGGRRQAVGNSVELSPGGDGGCLELSVVGGEQSPMSYRGSLLLDAESGRLRVVNRVGLEDYVRGVVSNEVFALGGAEAFKVQAVVSRTYALYESLVGHRHLDGVDVCSTGLHCQEYWGQATETSWGDDAVKATAGEVLTYRGEPICAYYHDNGGGCTELADRAGWTSRASDFPYIASVKSPDDEAGRLLDGFEWCYEWGPELDARIRGFYGDRTVLDPEEIGERLTAVCKVDVGEVRELVIREWTPSRRVSALDVVGTRDTYTVRGTDDDVRKVLRTPSSLITSIEKVGDVFYVTGRGRAHGVGLSQQGAMGMAIRCERYEDILQYYYRGVELTPEYGAGDATLARLQ